MLLISEYKLDTETINNYKLKGFRVAYGYENPKINKGEAVGFLLDSMYKSTIDLIEYLLYTKHKIILKYKNNQYKLQSLDEWKLSYREGHRTFYKKHPILIEYEAKRLDYLEQLERTKNKIKQEELLEKYNFQNKPKDLDAFVDTFSRLYNLNVDLNDDVSKIICYNQIQGYMELGLTYMYDDLVTAHTLEGQTFMYSNCIDIYEQDIFKPEAFKQVPYEEPISITTYGNEIYLEDTIYKRSDTDV